MLRPGAYGLLERGDDLVGLVRVHNHLVIAGGGIDPGEDVLTALHREVAEETGLTVDVVASLGIARQVIPRRSSGTMNKVCHYFRCRVTGRGEPVEQDHELLWLPVERALDEIWLPADRWAIELAYGSSRSPPG